MSNHSNGLRFDVYERVHLPDDVLGIDELEEIELVPRIQVLQQGEQVSLKGHLLLSGVYRANNDRADAQSLEHWIPVEITLPLNRISRLDDISVEIDNFDVDLLSARTLNITGVLSLLGIEIEQAAQSETWAEEPFTVVHERAAEEGAEPQAASATDYYANWAASEEGRRFQEAQHAIELSTAEREREAAEQLERQVQLQREQEAALWRQQEEILRQQREQEELWRQQVTAQVEQEQAARQAQETTLQHEQEERERQEREALSRAIEAAADEVRVSWQPEPAGEQQADNAVAADEWRGTPSEETETVERPEAPVEASQQRPSEPEPESEPEPASQSREVYSPFTNEVIEAADEADNAAVPAVQAGQPQQPDPIQRSSEADARKEMKVAVSGKPALEPDDQAASGGGLGFRTLLTSSQRDQEAKAAAEQKAKRAAEEAKRSNGDEIEWKRLFLNRSAEDGAFRKMRIAIVQREDTLDSIAGRYQLQAREIALYNRLNDQNVSEGQVLYIP